MPTTYAIKNGRTVFTPTLYTGNATNRSISNAASGTSGFKPDLVWIKSRSNVASNILTDSVRGVNSQLISNSNAVPETNTVCLTAFNSNGFSLGTNSVGGSVNENGFTYVGWQWQAGQGTTSTNTNGSITSTVSVNQTAGFSIVTYTGTGANATVGHGLGAVPNFIIVKNISSTFNWSVYTTALGNTNSLFLNTTTAVDTSINYWNNTSPTSSVFSLGISSNGNGSGNSMVAYCWTAIPGFSAFGSYTGNASTTGPFIYTGFRPAYVIIKNANNATTNWMIEDSTRTQQNIMGQYLFSNTSDAEGTNIALAFLSNGFVITDNGATYNGSGNTMIYAAFAECPFKYANAR